MRKLNATFGFTTIELMVALAIGAILVAMALPGFKSTLLKYRLSSRANDFFTALTLARSESVKRNGLVSVCQSADGLTCTTTGGWEQGWIVFYDVNGNGVVDTPDCSVNTQDCIIRTGGAFGTGYTMSGSAGGTAVQYITFSSSGWTPGAKATFTLSHSPDVEDRKICVDITGRAKVLQPLTPGTAAPPCP
ncbi:MAG: GspH/FimT family pseudopilin [Burkholderiales bacterium]